MALTLPEEATDPVAAVIQELEAAEYRPDAVLRRAVVHADGIAPAVIALVEKAAEGIYLLPKQQRLFFWGLHVVAAARCTTLYQPLLRLLRLDRAEYLDVLFGNALTESLPRVIISVFDGDATPLFELCSQKSADEYLRWGVFEAIARLTSDGAIPRPMTVEFLSRFERENLADPGEAAWEGWQDAIALLGVEELRDRVRATWRDERSPSEPSDQEIIEEWFARSLAPSDPELFDCDGRKPIDDPAEALAWTASESPERKQEDNPFGPDPAADIALQEYEIRWLSGFLDSSKVPETTLTLEWVDGLFCALNVGPSAPPSEYMPVIWNPEDEAEPDDGPCYDSAEQAEHVVGLLNRQWNTIARRLDAGSPHWPALECQPEELDARYWAGGFIRGVAMRANVWGTRKDNEYVMAFLQMMVTLGMTEKDLSKSDIDFELREKLVDALPIQLVRMHHLWHGREDPFPPPTSTRYEGRKIGRNEPCPCGSGKKFKRCCGSPTSSFH
jgi:yecA family protein